MYKINIRSIFIVLFLLDIVGTIVSATEILPTNEKYTLGPYDSHHKYYIRLYNVDDVEKAIVNGKPVTQINYQQDSGWIDITNYLTDGSNTVELTDENGVYGGWTYGFEIRQDDSNIIWKDSCGTAGTIACMTNDGTQGLVYRNIITLKLGTSFSVAKSASPYSIRQFQETTIKVSIENTGTTDIKAIEVIDSIHPSFDLISGDFPNPKKYDIIRTGESREIQYTIKAKESGSFTLDPATITYADSEGNIQEVKSEPVSIKVVPSADSTSNAPSDQLSSSKSSASVSLTGEKTDVVLGEDILLKLSAVNLITKPKMHVQVIIILPSGMSVTSSEFSKSGTNQFTANYELDPGDGKDIEVNIKPNQIGDFNVNGRIIYYFGDEKDKGEDYTLNLPIKVRKEITSASAQEPITNSVPKTSSGFGATIGISSILFIILLKKRL